MQFCLLCSVHCVCITKMDWISFKSDKSKKWMNEENIYTICLCCRPPFTIPSDLICLPSSIFSLPLQSPFFTNFLAFILIFNLYLLWAADSSGMSFEFNWQIIATISCSKGTKNYFLLHGFFWISFRNNFSILKYFFFSFLLLLLLLLPPNETLMTANDVFLAFNPFECMLNNAMRRITWNDARWTMIELHFFSLPDIHLNINVSFTWTLANVFIIMMRFESCLRFFFLPLDQNALTVFKTRI